MTTLSNHNQILEAFSLCDNPEKAYTKIMEIGKRQVLFSPEEKAFENLVRGCQSELYLLAELKEGKIYFRTYADALISAGLAQLLVWFYNGVSCEEMIKTPPSFLEELNIPASLTPSRANGLYSIHLRMKQEALKFLLASQKSSLV
jgi:cysteine desulfuration protein SufE